MQIDGEVNLPSPWIQRLELALRRESGQLTGDVLQQHEVHTTTLPLHEQLLRMPSPSAPALLPSQLSASSYNSLVACPYQFFAERMLRLTIPDELSEQPGKRDYGQWVHAILQHYHETLSLKAIPVDERAELLEKISDDLFSDVLQKQPAALGYAVDRKSTRLNSSHT